MRFDLDATRLGLLFPAHLVIGPDLTVRAIGPSLARQLPKLKLGLPLLDHFVWAGGRATDAMPALAASGQAIQLASWCGKVRLTGSVLACDEGYLLALRHVPSEFLLGADDLQISDFPPDDPLVAGLMLVGMQRAMIEDSRSVAMELAYERQRSFDLLDRISRVAGFMAHDFNNFLSIIKLNCERLSREMELDPRVQRLVAIIRDTAIRGSDITRSLMTLSRQRSDSCVSITIDSLIRENLAFFKTVVGSKLELQIHLDAGDPAVLVSRVGILNSLVNLLINARDAMADGGAITISTGLRRALLDIPGSKAPAVMQDYVAIEVADTGAGMSHDVLSKAFEPLFSTKAHGNGIGLASVLEFAREMGGDACLDSSLGKGARIYIYLPVSDGAAPDAASANVPIAHRHAAFGAKAVLLVEDEPYALEALSEMLEAEGLAVTACGSAAQAQAALAHGQYRVLLTDIIMPGESGANLARQACAQQPGLKVILMSGYVPDAEELQADWQFIRKPMDTQMLLEMIHAALAQPDFAG